MTERKQNKNLKPFEKGQSGNPDGRPPVPAEIKEAAALTNKEFILLTTELLLTSPQDLKARIKKPKSPLELMIANVINIASSGKDMGRINFLLDRTIGKVKEVSENNLNFKGQSLHMTLVEMMQRHRAGDKSAAAEQ